MNRYFHADKVLPTALVDEISKHVSGAYLWIPSRRQRKREHIAEYIVHLRLDARLTIEEIAARTVTSQRQVYRILMTYRHRNPDDPRLPRRFCSAKG